MFQTLFPLFVLAVLTAFTVAVMIYLPNLLAKRSPSPRKISPYECGIIPETDAQERFPIKFFLIAIDFVVFDVEIVFLYPWAIIYDKMALYGLLSMGVFLVLVILSFIYVVGKGGLKWE